MKKLFFLFIFLTYLLVFYSNFKGKSSLDVELNSASNEYPHCILLTDPANPKIKKILEKCDDNVIIMFFQVFLIFGVARSVKSMVRGYSLDAELNSTPMSSPTQNLSKTTGRYVKNTNKKIVFSFLPPKLINIILLF